VGQSYLQSSLTLGQNRLSKIKPSTKDALGQDVLDNHFGAGFVIGFSFSFWLLQWIIFFTVNLLKETIGAFCIIVTVV